MVGIDQSDYCGTFRNLLPVPRHPRILAIVVDVFGAAVCTQPQATNQAHDQISVLSMGQRILGKEEVSEEGGDQDTEDDDVSYGEEAYSDVGGICAAVNEAHTKSCYPLICCCLPTCKTVICAVNLIVFRSIFC